MHQPHKEVNEVPEMTKIKIPNYTMKMQIYPSAAQKEKLDKIFHALHVAYNITFHEVFQKNPMYVPFQMPTEMFGLISKKSPIEAGELI